MNFYYFEPEVAGGWGKNTVFDRTPGRPTIVHKLHYEFQGWMGDELLESTPCFIVSQRVAREIERSQFTGAGFDEVEITASDQFQELYPDRQLPVFVWFKVDGNAGRDDFGIAPDGRLVVSERAIEMLRSFALTQAMLTEFSQ